MITWRSHFPWQFYRSVLRRFNDFGRNGRKSISGNTVTVDFLGYTAKKGELVVDIKPKEIQLLQLLLKNKGHVLTRQQMIDSIWKPDEMPTDRVIDVYIKNLRKKLWLDWLVTVKGIGYKYEETTWKN